MWQYAQKWYYESLHPPESSQSNTNGLSKIVQRKTICDSMPKNGIVNQPGCVVVYLLYSTSFVLLVPQKVANQTQVVYAR